MKLNYLVILICSLLLTACSPDNTPKTKLFEDQRNALNKAKEIDSKIQQQALELQQNIEKQSKE